MKKLSIFLVAFGIFLSQTVLCFAEEFANPPIIDGAGYLTEEEFSELSAQLEELRQKYQFDVAVVTETQMSGNRVKETADDIFDYNGYGAGENDDGILLYICKDSREYWFTTHAAGMVAFNEYGIEYLKSMVQPELANDRYADAIYYYIETADELLKRAANGDPYSTEDYESGYVMLVILVALILPLLIAWIVTAIRAASMKTAVRNDYAANYMQQQTPNLNASRDTFLYSTITKTAKPKNHSSTTSSGHRSSSGRTHGGGGGSF